MDSLFSTEIYQLTPSEWIWFQCALIVLVLLSRVFVHPVMNFAVQVSDQRKALTIFASIAFVFSLPNLIELLGYFVEFLNASPLDTLSSFLVGIPLFVQVGFLTGLLALWLSFTESAKNDPEAIARAAFYGLVLTNLILLTEMARALFGAHLIARASLSQALLMLFLIIAWGVLWFWLAGRDKELFHPGDRTPFEKAIPIFGIYLVMLEPSLIVAGVVLLFAQMMIKFRWPKWHEKSLREVSHYGLYPLTLMIISTFLVPLAVMNIFLLPTFDMTISANYTAAQLGQTPMADVLAIRPSLDVIHQQNTLPFHSSMFLLSLVVMFVYTYRVPSILSLVLLVGANLFCVYWIQVNTGWFEWTFRYLVSAITGTNLTHIDGLNFPGFHPLLLLLPFVFLQVILVLTFFSEKLPGLKSNINYLLVLAISPWVYFVNLVGISVRSGKDGFFAPLLVTIGLSIVLIFMLAFFDRASKRH